MRSVPACVRASIACAIALAMVAAGLRTPVAWADGSAPSPAASPGAPHFEVWVGAQAFDRVWSLYSGLTASPLGGIREDGLRLRVAGGHSAYSYKNQQGAKIAGSASFADLLIGYHKQLGPVTVKAFGGLMLADQQLEPDDPGRTIRGPGAGAKVALETWWNISERVWTSVNLSWGSRQDNYATRARLGWRAVPALSVGLEAEATGNADGDIARAGGFLRYEWASGELSVSGGLSNDKLFDDAARSSLDASVPYATLRTFRTISATFSCVAVT